ncbi:uncharacterized protein LOC117229617 isoform X4 [Megalopta genalis]|uniref:uncharacterized protein LOC117229617 isoform X4 n=1 Tax=Megalopta genalis TaxID=115081 RepID=UPI003FD5B88F
MPKELPLYQDYVNFVKRCLLMCGLYPYQRSIASRYLPFCWILGYCVDFCALINFFRLYITEISAITACLSVLSGIVNMTIRCSRFVICREKLMQVADTLEALFQETAMQQPPDSPAFQFMLPFYRLGYYHYVCMVNAAMPVVKAASVILYLTGKVLQTFMYTWSGGVVTSEEVCCNNWYEDTSVKTGKLTLTILMQKSMILKACRLMAVSDDLFAKIINRAISYYFLLLTLDDDE